MKCRSWALVHILPDCRYKVVDYFANRSDAENMLEFLHRGAPQLHLEIVFEIATDPLYWEEQYQNKHIPWDIGQPTPAFLTLLNSPFAPTPSRAAVLGCGRGYDGMTLK